MQQDAEIVQLQSDWLNNYVKTRLPSLHNQENAKLSPWPPSRERVGGWVQNYDYITKINNTLATNICYRIEM